MPRGRPRKYTTDAERLEANRLKVKKSKQKKKNEKGVRDNEQEVEGLEAAKDGVEEEEEEEEEEAEIGGGDTVALTYEDHQVDDDDDNNNTLINNPFTSRQDILPPVQHSNLLNDQENSPLTDQAYNLPTQQAKFPTHQQDNSEEEFEDDIRKTKDEFSTIRLCYGTLPVKVSTRSPTRLPPRKTTYMSQQHLVSTHEEERESDQSNGSDTIRLEQKPSTRVTVEIPLRRRIYALGTKQQSMQKKKKKKKKKEKEKEPSSEELLQGAAQWLDNQLASTPGCRRHEEEESDEENTTDLKGLAEYWGSHGIPDVLSIEGLLSKQEAENPVNWEAALSDGQFPPPRLLLASSECKGSAATVAFDIDSFIAHAYSLAIFKTGIRYSLDPFVRYNIQKNLHVSVNGKVLHKTPHLLFGRCRTEESYILYIVFPNLRRRVAEEEDEEEEDEEEEEGEEEEGEGEGEGEGERREGEGEGEGERRRGRGTYTTQLQRQLFTDKLLLPAIEEVCPLHVRRNYPFSYQHGRDKTLGCNKGSKNKDQERRRAVSIPIGGKYLEEIWSTMVRFTRRPTLSCFRGMFIVVNCKNSKLVYQSTTSFQAVRQQFLDDINVHMDMAKLNTSQAWVDIGRELVPNSSHQARTFLWRKCCLDKWYDSLCHSVRSSGSGGSGENSRRAHRMQYQSHLLKEVGSTTVELGGGNPLRKGGIMYAQRYNTMKSLFDAQGKYPFTSKAIEGFLVPKELSELWKTAGGGKGSWSASLCHEIYLTSKARVQHALESAGSGLFGVREEYRIQWSLFCELDPGPTIVANPNSSRRSCYPYWRIFTQDILEFIRWELNRWLACLEWIHARRLHQQLTHNYTVMSTILARLARISVNNEAIHTDYNVWKDTWTTQNGLYREGLDLESSMTRYGLAWLPAGRFDWQHLCPKEKFQDNCAFQYNAIRTAYQRRRSKVTTVDELYRHIQLIAASLENEGEESLRIKERLNWLHRLCYREFSKYILDSCKKEFRTDMEILPVALSGDGSITWDHMHYVLGKIPNLHKSRKKVLDKTWAQCIQQFFEWDDGLRRPQWDKKLYRLIRVLELELILLSGLTPTQHHEVVLSWKLQD